MGLRDVNNLTHFQQGSSDQWWADAGQREQSLVKKKKKKTLHIPTSGFNQSFIAKIWLLKLQHRVFSLETHRTVIQAYVVQVQQHIPYQICVILCAGLFITDLGGVWLTINYFTTTIKIDSYQQHLVGCKPKVEGLHKGPSKETFLESTLFKKLCFSLEFIASLPVISVSSVV